MDAPRPSTPSSQRTYVAADRPGQYPTSVWSVDHGPEVFVDHGPEVVVDNQPYRPEKSAPIPSTAYAPQAFEQQQTHQQQDAYWAHQNRQARYESVPPRYPGTPVNRPQAPPPPPAGSPVEETICGVRRGLFLLLLGLGGLILMGIAVGVGVGVGLSNQNRSTAPAASPSVTSPTSSLPSATPTPTASGTTTVANALCPDSSNTHFTTSNGKNFLHICGIDYSGPNEAEDIFKVGTATFDECMEMCANNDECTGAGWGLSGSPSKVCYMKSNLSTPHVAVSSWNFAVLLVT